MKHINIIYIYIWHFIVYCCTPKALCNHVCVCVWGVLSSTTTSVQHPLGWCDGCHRTTAPVRSPHTSYRWRGERDIEPIEWMGIIRRPWVEGIWPGHWGYTPTLYEKCHGIFNDHRESGPRLTSHLKDGAFYSIVSLSLYWGIRTHTDHRVSTPCWPH